MSGCKGLFSKKNPFYFYNSRSIMKLNLLQFYNCHWIHLTSFLKDGSHNTLDYMYVSFSLFFSFYLLSIVHLSLYFNLFIVGRKNIFLILLFSTMGQVQCFTNFIFLFLF